MLLVNLKVILEKHGKPLTSLLPVAPKMEKYNGERIYVEWFHYL